MRVTRVFGVALAMCASRLGAQERPLPYWQHTAWMGENGPASAGEFAIRPSADGYLWLGGVNGVVRFDGIRFTAMDSTNTPPFRRLHPDHFDPSLLDRQGRLWINGSGGSLFTYANGVIRSVLPEESPALTITEDGDGRLWVLTAKGLRLLENGRLVAAPLPAGVPDTAIFGVQRDTANGLWIGTVHEGLWHVGRNGVERFGTGRIRALLQGHDGVVWGVGDGLGPGLYRLVAGKWSQVHPPNAPTRAILTRCAVEGPDGSVWIATPNMGLLRWHNDQLEQFSKADGLSDDRVTDIYADREGAVWVATDAGLDRLRPSIFTSIEQRNGLPFDGGKLFAEDTSGAVWTASSGAREQYLLDGGIIRNRPGPIVATQIAASDTGSLQILAPSRAGGVWIGPISGGLLHLGVDGQRAYGAGEGFPPARMGIGFEARDGTLWLRSVMGEIGRFRNGRYEAFPMSAADRPLPHGIADDALGRTWLVSAKRHVTILARDSVVDRFVLPPGDSTSITFLAFESGETMWAATTRSLIRIAGRRAVELRVSSLAPLLATSPQFVVSHGWLWIAAEAAVARVSLDELNRAADGTAPAPTVELFGALDGLSIARTPTLTPTIIRAGRDGRVWVATTDGLAVADPDFRIATVRPRHARIEEISVGGKALDLRDGGAVQPKPDRIEFRFTTPTLLLPERVRMQYRLDGADEQWVDATVPRVATYNRLRPGSYRFRVRAWDEAGNRVPEEATLAFRVLPAWYQSWWFTALCVAAVALGVFAGAVMWQKRRSSHAAERARVRFETVLAERERIARELHDTLLQGFTGITLQLESVRGTLEERSDPNARELAQILHQADATLREAREMVWDIRSPNSGSADFDAALESVCRRALSQSVVSLTYTSTGNPRHIPNATESAILRVAREAVFNALQHGRPSAIWVQFAYEPKQVTLVVRDNGVGTHPERITAATLEGHWGIAGMRERALRARGSLAIETAVGEGMRLTLWIPAEPVV